MSDSHIRKIEKASEELIISIKHFRLSNGIPLFIDTSALESELLKIVTYLWDTHDNKDMNYYVISPLSEAETNE